MRVSKDKITSNPAAARYTIEGAHNSEERVSLAPLSGEAALKALLGSPRLKDTTSQ